MINISLLSKTKIDSHLFLIMNEYNSYLLLVYFEDYIFKRHV